MDDFEYPRLLQPPERSFFLFGPRGVGKSTWLKKNFKDAKSFNLLDSRQFLRFSKDPRILGDLVDDLPPGAWVWIDEIQKVPALLDEVHRLMEEKRIRFALSGSSARKLRRGGANLLAGRAITRQMEPFSFAELGRPFELKKALEFGLLPLVVLHPQDASDILNAYVHTYIKEEIREEGAVRKVEPFLRFLEVAGAMNGMQLNSSNIAREAQVSRSSVDNYFSVLVDTLVGHFLPAYRPRVKSREEAHPKFYWFDPGVARASAGLIQDPPDSLWLGRSLETLIFHELRVYNEISGKRRPIAYYRTKSGSEIDFVIETRKASSGQPKPAVVCLEIKHSKKWDRSWETPMRSLREENGVSVDKMVGIYLGSESLNRGDIEVLPYEVFLKRLYAGEVF
jgi:predicted AAA+ superfamily ATPase